MVKKSGITDKPDGPTVCQTSMMYSKAPLIFDGVRAESIQTVAKQASPLGHDMVVPQVYDAFGR